MAGKPEPVVTWWKGDEQLGRVTPSPGTQIRSEVSLKNLGRGDLHSELTCQATNNNRTQPLTSTVHIDMNFPPLNVQILGSMQSLSAGRRYDLLCQSSGSRPPASITWWKDSERLERTKETTSSDGNTTTSTLSFIASKEDAGKYLSCRSSNTLVSSDELESGWKLEIQYVPECKIELGKSLNKNAIREGSDVYFDCLVKAEPPVYKVEWRHNNRQLHHNIGQGIIISNQSLVLQGVSRSSAGNYSCVGFNSEGDSESNLFHLNILYAPRCRPNQMRVHGIAKAEKATISCSVEANPPEVSFRWLFNNSAESIDVASSHITKSGTVSMVSYTPRTEMDYGTLLCWARNSIGDQKVPCVFHIIAAGRPDPVINCSIGNVSITSFSIKCTEGFNGGLPQSFFLEVLKMTTQGIKTNTTSPFPRFNIENLEAGAQYHLLVYAFNPKGRSEPVVLQASTLRLPEKQLTSEKGSLRWERRKSVMEMTPLITIAGIIGGALLLMALAIALVLRLQCYRANRRKRHKSGQDSTSSPVSKLDQSGCASGDSDEKNPDVIPQPDTVEEEGRVSYTTKRQRISTIETTSPTRGLLAAGLQGSGPQGYCTLRNGAPLRDMPHLHHPLVSACLSACPSVGEMSFTSGSCTIPRNHWVGPYPSQPRLTAATGAFGAPTAIRLSKVPRSEEESSADGSLVVPKIESTV
ncbi:hypothetical protein RUM43_006884 [Polyplax serrata]|uniref:Nephrin/kirre n=1 Tax=Polyplax serrata TaxID=468196 RepID=A0AAN8PWB2_POLSC